jgi:hypothetical protein
LSGDGNLISSVTELSEFSPVQVRFQTRWFFKTGLSVPKGGEKMKLAVVETAMPVFSISKNG